MYIIVYFFLFYNFYAIIRTGETMRSIKETTTNTIIIKKSEFITTLIPCNDEKEIKDLIELYSKDDATHNCVAYRVGPLEKADDDGEPSGTAGLPMLNVLQRQKIDNVIAIVTRYFGGIKLGAGGLTRAYAGAAQAVVDEMDLSPYVPMVQVQILAEFATEAQCRYVVDSLNGSIDDVAYSKQVTLTVTLAEADIDHLKERLAMDGRVLDASKK